MDEDLVDFKRFMKEREAAAQAYTCGDARPIARIATHKHDATFFGPGGGHTQGAHEVVTTYEHDAKAFEPGGDSHLEILQMGANDGIAYWTGYQLASARMQGKPEPIPMKLRITELFRREGDAWRLIHRHADTNASEPKKK